MNVLSHTVNFLSPLVRPAVQFVCHWECDWSMLESNCGSAFARVRLGECDWWSALQCDWICSAFRVLIGARVGSVSCECDWSAIGVRLGVRFKTGVRLGVRLEFGVRLPPICC